MTSKELREQANACFEEAQSICEEAKKNERALTEEEQVKVRELIEKDKGLNGQAELLEGVAAREKHWNASEAEPPATDPNENPVTEERKGFANSGDFLQAVARSSRPGARIDPRLEAQIRAITGMGESVPSDGGFLVDSPLQNRILETVWDNVGLAGRCDRLPVGPGANGVKLPYVDDQSHASSLFGGVICYWTDEGGTITSSAPKMGRIEMQLEKITGLLYSTDELMMDATSLGAWADRAFPKAITWFVEEALINGDGAGKPEGVMTSPALVTVDKETNQAAATIVGENIKKMYARMDPNSIPNSGWYINQSCWPQLFGLHQVVGTGGVPLFVPAGGLSQAPYGTLMGRPIFPTEHCQVLGTTGDIIFADWSEYLIIDKGNVEAASSIHVSFTSGQTCFRYVYRINGQTKRRSTMTTKYGGSSNTLSPFVALQTRS